MKDYNVLLVACVLCLPNIVHSFAVVPAYAWILLLVSYYLVAYTAKKLSDLSYLSEYYGDTNVTYSEYRKNQETKEKDNIVG